MEANYDDLTLQPGEDRDFKNQFTEFLQKNMAPVESKDMDPGAKKMPKRTTLQHKKKLEAAKKKK